MRSSSGPLSRRWWRARSAARAAAGVLAHAARAGVRRGDEREARREDHHALGADDRHAAVLERLAQRLERRPGELGELVEEEHAVVGERRLPRRRRRRRRRRGRRPRSCGAARGTGAGRPARRSCWPAIDCEARDLDRLVRASSAAGCDGSRRASIVLPVPGGPCRNRLWPPAAATSSAGTSALWPRTSARSGSSQRRLGAGRPRVRDRRRAALAARAPRRPPGASPTPRTSSSGHERRLRGAPRGSSRRAEPGPPRRLGDRQRAAHRPHLAVRATARRRPRTRRRPRAATGRWRRAPRSRPAGRSPAPPLRRYAGARLIVIRSLREVVARSS